MGKREEGFRKEIQEMARQVDENMQRNMNNVELLKSFSNLQKMEKITRPMSQEEKKYFFGEER